MGGKSRRSPVDYAASVVLLSRCACGKLQERTLVGFAADLLGRSVGGLAGWAAYLLLPVGSRRAVLLGSDVRVEEPSRSDTIVITKTGGGTLAIPRGTLTAIPGVGKDKVNAALAYGGAGSHG